jgi:polar amino acid transport system permease protein
MIDAPELILQYVVSPIFMRGAATTLLITILSMTLGIVVGLIIALLQQVRIKAIRFLVTAYLWLFRGTPVLFQLIFVFYVLPGFGIMLSGFTSGVLALSLNEAAYTAEIFRSGLQAVGRGQRTAGRSLGMREWQVMRYVVLPQAMRVVIPPLGNQFLGMLKLSALVSTIAVQDLLLVANQTASANFRYFEALSAAGIYYLAMTTVFMIIQFQIERWAGRRSRPTSWTQRLLGMTADATQIR